MEQSDRETALRPLLDGHEQLVDQIEAIRQWWQELDEVGRPKFGEMGDRIAEFREMLAAHFADEERGGYLQAAIQGKPELNEAAKALRKQHPQLLADTDALIEQLKSCDPLVECWRDARERFEALVEAIRRHESEENVLIDQLISGATCEPGTRAARKPR